MHLPLYIQQFIKSYQLFLTGYIINTKKNIIVYTEQIIK